MEIANLNEVQIEAVRYTEGPSMIIAGAGSGKTKVLTSRIAYLVKEKNVSAFNILALTFTNKAAREMRDRVEKITNQEGASLWLGTFHSVFSRILRVEADSLGYSQNFTIYDRDDSKSVIKSIIKELDLDDKIYNPNMVMSRISNAKNRLLSAKQYYEDPICQSDDHTAKRPMLGKIYLKYEQKCFKANAMDFDDILINTYRLFNQNPEILYKYQERFKYILIDEFQDTNLVQHKIIKDLASIHRNICVVGDDAQSIYAFRGANIYNMLNFKKDYPEVRIFKLEQNYRSTKNIVNAANSLIKHNKDQMPKSSWTDNNLGEPIFINQNNSDIEEAKNVVRSIHDIRMRQYLSYDNFAVLYRTNTQSRTIEEELRKANIPYKIIGGLSFYQRKEIKDVLAYLRFILNHNDEEALKRIINVPKRGIGPTSIDKIIIAAYDNDISLWEVLCNIKHFLNGKVTDKIEEFVQMIKAASILSQEEDAYSVTSMIIKRSGILQALYEEKRDSGSLRYENAQELLSGIKNFVEDPENDDKSLAAFVQEIALVTGLDQTDSSEPKVTLMTIHSSKGLEFENVYIVGIEENLFPSQMMTSSKEDLEEERRLFYVAITRAKKTVHLSYALRRFRFGKQVECEPSRFINEIDEKYIKGNNNFSTYKKGERNMGLGSLISKKIINFKKKVVTKKPSNFSERKEYDPDFIAADPNTLKEGLKVKHSKFGIGEIRLIENIEGTKKARVYFKNFGEKTLLLSFAKLAILD